MVKKSKPKSKPKALPKTIRIEVTKQDIMDGQRLSAAYCPIAKAAHRALPQVKKLFMTGFIEGIYGRENFTYRPCSPRAHKFIEDFDNGLAVKPFKFSAKLIDLNQE